MRLVIGVVQRRCKRKPQEGVRNVEWPHNVYSKSQPGSGDLLEIFMLTHTVQ